LGCARESGNITNAREVNALVGIPCPIEMRWKVKRQKERVLGEKVA
jgi:hypothetical protein